MRCTPWWAAWQPAQETTRVDIAFAPPGLRTELRYLSALLWVWRWPTGQALLEEAARLGVQVVTGSRAAVAPAFARYATHTRTVEINEAYAQCAAWLLAALIVHEASHAVNHGRGRYAQGRADPMRDDELAAFEMEGAFVAWVSVDQHGLPSHDMVAKQASASDFVLFRDLYEVATTDDLARLLAARLPAAPAHRRLPGKANDPQPDPRGRRAGSCIAMG